MQNLRNSVRLIGNLGNNPEIKAARNNAKLVKFSLATSEWYKNSEGTKVSETTWHNIVAWGNQARIAEMYLQKGTEVALEGKITNRNYTDKDGIKHYITEIMVSEILMVSKAKM